MPPTASGLRKLLSKIDVTVLEDALTRWITAVLPEETPPAGLIPIALDGKSLRGTWNRFDRAVHLLNVVDQRTKTVIHQRVVPGDTNEHKVALELLKDLVLTGRVVTADAAFCHQDVCDIIVEGGGHYVLPVKDNQPQLVAAISSEFTAHDAVLSSRKKHRPPTPSVNAVPNATPLSLIPRGTAAARNGHSPVPRH